VKQNWLHVAEVFDSWRVIPRLILGAYCYFVWHITNYILVWYTHEPPGARGVEESGTVAAIFTCVTGFAPWIFKIYSENGRDWTQQPASTSTVVATSTTVNQ
jgi:hypothetical protein